MALAVLAVGGFALSGDLTRPPRSGSRGRGRSSSGSRVDAVVGFDVTPDVLEVARGTHVVLDVVNEGDEDHDLAVAGGAKTRTLGPGESERLDLGIATDRDF